MNHPQQVDTKEPTNFNENPIETQPWPMASIFTYTTIKSGKWGTLEFYEPESELVNFRFNPSLIPRDDEIIKRWGKYLLKKAPMGQLTYDVYKVKIPMGIYKSNSGFFIGCCISDTQGVNEGGIFWNTHSEAVSAYLTESWEQNRNPLLIEVIQQ
jgi:hypothetical protein